MRKTVMMAVALALVALPLAAGEYHVDGNLACYDCHTMHFSQSHGWQGGTVGTTPVAGGDWLSATGPNKYLLKAPVNQICLECHDGKTFAPDVLEANFNASPTQGRAAGALNSLTSANPYEGWKGHTLNSTTTPPGFNGAGTLNASGDTYDATAGLSCINCHTQHGRPTAYRNLGPRYLGGATFEPTYNIGTTQDTSKDVWVNVDPATLGTAGARAAAVFNPYYDLASIRFNKSLPEIQGTTTLSAVNKMDIQCASCHDNFHQIGGTGTPPSEFVRHPSGQDVNIGGLTGGHSNLDKYRGTGARFGTTVRTNKVRVYTNDYLNYTGSSPGCLSCHKAHGNKNPFALVFMAGSGTVTEEGTTVANYTEGQRALCGQCHVQGS